MDGQVIYSYLPEQTFNGLRCRQIPGAGKPQTPEPGGWTQDFPILEFHVHLPWYKTGWFYLTLVLGVSGILLFFIFSFFRKRENRLKMAMKEKRETDIRKKKVRLLININHELRTPLTLIHAPLKQLLINIPPQDRNHLIVSRICKQTDRIKSLLNMVLNVRKMEVSSTSVRLEPVCLHQWVEELINDFKPEQKTEELPSRSSPTRASTSFAWIKKNVPQP